MNEATKKMSYRRINYQIKKHESDLEKLYKERDKLQKELGISDESQEINETVAEMRVGMVESLERDLAEAHPDDVFLRDPDIRAQMQRYIKVMKGERIEPSQVKKSKKGMLPKIKSLFFKRV